MEEQLGGNRSFHMSEANTPIAYQAAQFFNTTDERLNKNGGKLTGYAEVTQDNLAELIRAVANLELEVQKLKDR